jgi:hypothetical protein
MNGFQNVVQQEGGPRFMMTGTYKDVPVEIATGYDVTSDVWRVHVYLTPGGKRQKMNSPVAASTMHDAFNSGFATARAAIEQG